MTEEMSAREVQAALAAPFPAWAVKSKVQTVKGDRAIAVFYLDARAIEDRLDEVLGIDGWEDDYLQLENGSVICRLKCRIAGRWVTKMDVGSPSEQPDEGDRTKAAFSDAIKRAAVKFGIGRALYRVPVTWHDYDPQAKRFKSKPQLPPEFLPPKVPARRAETPPQKPAQPVQQQQEQHEQSPPKADPVPRNMGELRERFLAIEDKHRIPEGLLWKKCCERVFRDGEAPGDDGAVPADLRDRFRDAMKVLLDAWKRRQKGPPMDPARNDMFEEAFRELSERGVAREDAARAALFRAAPWCTSRKDMTEAEAEAALEFLLGWLDHLEGKVEAA